MGHAGVTGVEEAALRNRRQYEMDKDLGHLGNSVD